MKYDLVIYNAKIVTEEEVFLGYICVSDGKITAMGSDAPVYEAAQSLDAKGMLLLPGAIDTHPHFFEPGAEAREDLEHGTQAAASGGFTTILDMPNTPEHPVLDLEAFALKQERAERKALIDYAFWGAATPKNIEQFVPLHKQGCVGFKAFTVYAGSNYPFSDEYSQLKEMEKVASFHGIFGAHAEDRTLVNGFSNEHKEEPWSLAVHDASRPWIAELTAINTLLLYAEKTGCKLHICHMSIPEGAERIASARRMGVDVTVETCAHYLTLNYQDQAYLGTFAMINPPLRSRDRMERLWKYVLDGTIDYLGTDHAPYLLSDKLPPDGDLRKAACGAPEIDVAIPLILEEGVRNRKMPLQRFAAFTSTNAAKRFGLYPRKGILAVGADADFYLVDMDTNWTYSRKNSFSASKLDKFAHEGRTFHCRIVSTWVRGNAVYRDGVIKQKPGYGRMIRPEWDSQKEKG